MCKHADQTKEVIDHLLNDVYPLLDLKIDHALQCFNLGASITPEKDLINDLLVNLKHEFHSLATYEEKLVFPSVLKVFHAKKAKTSLPNLGDLLQLTNRKENRINHYVAKIDQLINYHLWETGKQEELVYAFSNNFVQEKACWNKMIQDRLSSCNCFKKNYFEVARLYEDNLLNLANRSSKKN
ncbi:MAG: hypothetical protein EAZ12_03580 [Sphingobacteriia bacterium]|nr:MAG: hypothetical protein EAZ12_03580 [Sphingobacteriia bacterium]